MLTGVVIAGMFGPTEIVIIILVLVLLFGGRKIPELMRGLGQGMKEFKKATKDEPPKATDKPGNNEIES
ncbi:MAG: twin-arginine translocase TatA/TatE family subunit [Chlorobi bacterium]|nr:twin-arginine translocase TatA/TatE family subunit [Chlorobiota bacterium]